MNDTKPAPSGMTVEERKAWLTIWLRSSEAIGEYWIEKAGEYFGYHLTQAVAEAVAAERERYAKLDNAYRIRLEAYNEVRSKLDSERERHAAELADVRFRCKLIRDGLHAEIAELKEQIAEAKP